MCNQKSMNATKDPNQLFNSHARDSDNPSTLCWTNDCSRCRQLRVAQGEIMADLWWQYSGSSLTLAEYRKTEILHCNRHISLARLSCTFKQPSLQKWCFFIFVFFTVHRAQISDHSFQDRGENLKPTEISAHSLWLCTACKAGAHTVDLVFFKKNLWGL